MWILVQTRLKIIALQNVKAGKTIKKEQELWLMAHVYGLTFK